MMKFILYAFLLLPFAASAQKFSIRGQIFDETDKPLPSSTVMLLYAKDSSLARFTISDAQGRFDIKNVTQGSWLVKITFVGYKSETLAVAEPSGNIYDLGKITLSPDSLQLDEVTIQAEHIPVVVKKDTIEYNALSFKTQRNAVVEDLLKKMPGIEVESDGTIRAQGEEVKRVMVDGKEFFGRDPKLATQNLPADAVAKVQVTDRKSEQAQFSGIDDGQREKTINLTLKKDKKNGAFGNAMAGIGNSGRWQTKTNLNRFSKGNQLSLLGMANNTNQQGFGMEEYMLYSGAAQQMAGGKGVRLQINAENTDGVPINFGNKSNGLMTSYAGGVNLNHQLGKKTAVNSSYFFNQLDHNLDQTLTRENFQPDPENNFNYEEASHNENVNSNHRGNVTIDHTLDSANSLRFNGNFIYNTTRTTRLSNSETQKVDGTIQNSSDQYHTADVEAFNWDGSLLFRHKFEKKGRTFSANMDMELNQNSSDGLLQAHNQFYGAALREDSIDQKNEQANLTRKLGTTFSYTEPLGGRKYLEANYTIRQNLNTVDRSVYNMEDDNPVFDETLSNIYNSNYLFQRSGINIWLNRDHFNFTAGMALQWSELKGLLEIQEAHIHSTFSNLLPVARLNYEISSNKRLSLDYETSVEAPTIEQLQPVVDNRNPLNIYVGNPNLSPEYRHNWRLSFNTSNPSKFIGFFSFIDVTYTEDAIINAQSIDKQFIRYNTPVNMKDALSLRGNAHLSFGIPKINSRFNLGTTITDHYSVNLLNGIENSIRQSSVKFNIRYNYMFKEMVDVNLSALMNQQLTRYEMNQPSQAFLHQAYSAETVLHFLKNYQFTARYEYLMYESAGFMQEMPLMDLSVSSMLLKNKALELKLSAINLLNTNIGVSQQGNMNYLERQVANSLGRYYMVSLTYALNKQLNPMNGKRIGG